MFMSTSLQRKIGLFRTKKRCWAFLILFSMSVLHLRLDVIWDPRYWNFSHELMKRFSSMLMSAVSVSVGAYPGAGMNMNSVFEVTFFSLFPVWIVKPNLLKCESINLIAACALVKKNDRLSMDSVPTN